MAHDKPTDSLPGVSLHKEGHRATPAELLWDLVYVFAATRVTAFMADAHSGYGLLQGTLLLALLWWTWVAYAWLGSRAHGGVLRAGSLVAMAAMFVVALSIPEAWDDAPGGLSGPVVLVCAYVLVRAIHLALSAMAAADDTAMRHQSFLTWIPVLAGSALLLAGALLGGWKQTLLFAAALLVDWGGIYLIARNGSWRVYSAAHWNERHGLFIILAIGESLVSIGVGAAQVALSTPLLVAALLGVGVAIALWWLYFDVLSPAAEDTLLETHGKARTRMALEAYSYGHFPIVAGIIITALGLEGVLAHPEETKPLGVFYALALFGGVALYLAGHLLFKNRMRSALSLPRVITVLVLLGAVPAAAMVPPTAALADLVVILAVLMAFETIRYSSARQQLRDA